MSELNLKIEIDTSRLDAALSRAADDFTTGVNRALKACGTLVVATAIELAPVRRGDLRNSIRSDEPHITADGEIGIDIIGGGGELFYAPYQEFGTRYISARRFMRGALEKHETEIQGILGAAVQLAFEEVGA